MGKEYLFTLKNLNASTPLISMNIKSRDINLLYAPLFDLIRFKIIGIKKFPLTGEQYLLK